MGKFKIGDKVRFKDGMGQDSDIMTICEAHDIMNGENISYSVYYTLENPYAIYESWLEEATEDAGDQ